MDRRSFLAALASAAALPANVRAQSAQHIAWLSPTGAEDGSIFLDALRSGLREQGRADLRIDAYWGNDSAERLAEIIVAAIRDRPDVIVAQSSTAVAARRATSEIPLVFGYSGDPVEAKLVGSLARPGANATGISYMTLELVAKRMEILREALPRARRVAVLANPQHPGDFNERRASQTAADTLGLELSYFEARSAAELPAALAAIAAVGPDAAMMFPLQNIISRRVAIANWAREQRIPTISGWAQFAQGGNLLSYGPNLRDATRRLSAYVVKILNGAKPADLPVELPTGVELVINLRMARMLGVELPLTLLARADEVIE